MGPFFVDRARCWRFLSRGHFNLAKGVGVVSEARSEGGARKRRKKKEKSEKIATKKKGREEKKKLKNKKTKRKKEGAGKSREANVNNHECG